MSLPSFRTIGWQAFLSQEIRSEDVNSEVSQVLNGYKQVSCAEFKFSF